MRLARCIPRGAATAAVALALGSLLAASGVEAQDVPTAPPGNDATLRDTPAVNAAMPQALPGAKGATDGDLGEHQMTGVVRSVDPGTGTLLVDVGGKDLTVLFPATGLSRVAKGDRVTVTVALQKLDATQP